MMVHKHFPGLDVMQLPDNVLRNFMSLGVQGLLLQVDISEKGRYLLFIHRFIMKVLMTRLQK